MPLKFYIPRCRILTKRRQYGLSRPENGKIGYRAAIEELLIGEASSLGLESMQIPKGRYISIIVEDFGNKVTAISNAFNELLSVKGIDPNGYCVEYYINSTDVQCMVRLTDIIN